MADFLTTKAIASELEDIIRKANDEIFILTPYLKLSSIFFERLQEAIEKGIKCTIVYGKSELQKKEEKILYDLNCNILYKADMHGKCYANEFCALITSMNLHSYSEANNYEFGVLLNKANDSYAFNDCMSEIRSIIGRAEVKRETVIRKENSTKIEEESDDYFKVLNDAWYKHLKDNYSSYDFQKDEDSIYCNSFLSSKIDFSTKYGFVTFNFKRDYDFMKRKREQHARQIEDAMFGYRFYWNSDKQMSLYISKTRAYRDLDNDILYLSLGLKKLYSEVVRRGLV